MKKLLLLSAFIMCAASNPAFASEKFSGPFFGLLVGYTFGDVEYNYEDGATGRGDIALEDEFSGFEAGGFAGFRYQLKKLNLGLELGYLHSNHSGSFDRIIGGNNFVYDYEKDGEWYLSFKPGFLLSDNALFYGIVGYQEAMLDGDLSVNNATIFNDTESYHGYHFGAGLDYMVSDHFSIRAEYKYNHYEDEAANGPNSQEEKLGGEENVFRAGITYNFLKPSQHK